MRQLFEVMFNSLPFVKENSWLIFGTAATVLFGTLGLASMYYISKALFPSKLTQNLSYKKNDD